jgi:hypothetical protein
VAATVGDRAFSPLGAPASTLTGQRRHSRQRIYLGIHWAFDKTEGIAQGRQVARHVVRNAFGVRRF